MDPLLAVIDSDKRAGAGFCLSLYAHLVDEAKQIIPNEAINIPLGDGRWGTDFELLGRRMDMVAAAYRRVVLAGECPRAGTCRHYAKALARREKRREALASACRQLGLAGNDQVLKERKPRAHPARQQAAPARPAGQLDMFEEKAKELQRMVDLARRRKK